MTFRDAKHREYLEHGFEAKYPSDCAAGCQDGISAGDLIHQNAEGEYQHVDCDGDYLASKLDTPPGKPDSRTRAYDKPTKFEGTDLESMGF